MRTIRRRLPWLGLNLITTSLSASVIGLYQGTIQSMALAAALMTIVAAQGGNAGVQTLTVMVRGMALGKVGLAQARGILVKELLVACGNGVALGIAAGIVTYVVHGEPLLATVLGLALALNFLVAALVGSLIPLILRWLRADPAVASSVFVTACTDMCGFFAFLSLLSVGLRYFA
jgi:magnesium transporter